jgi:hypothetical protein
MDIRAAYDWGRRLTEWLDSDITAYIIRNAIAFVILWWLSRGYFRAAAAEMRAAQTAPDPVQRCFARGRCESRIGQSANCDSAIMGDMMGCGARAA